MNQISSDRQTKNQLSGWAGFKRSAGRLGPDLPRKKDTEIQIKSRPSTNQMIGGSVMSEDGRQEGRGSGSPPEYGWWEGLWREDWVKSHPVRAEGWELMGLLHWPLFLFILSNNAFNAASIFPHSPNSSFSNPLAITPLSFSQYHRTAILWNLFSLNLSGLNFS